MFLVIVISVLLLSLNFASAVWAGSKTHYVNSSDGSKYFNATEDTEFLFNITVNVTDPVTSANVTEVNITLWGNFTFINDTNGSTAFLNSSFLYNVSTEKVILSWNNKSRFSLINATGEVNFWFNATPINPRTINMTVQVVNLTAVYVYALNVTTNDTTAPVINIITPTNRNVTNASTFNVNITVQDYTTTNCTFYVGGDVFDRNASVLVETRPSVRVHVNFTNLTWKGDVLWYVNCTDSFNNVGNSSLYTLFINPKNISGQIRYENGIIVDNATINITVRKASGWSIVGYVTAKSNSTGNFNVSVAGNDSWMFEPKIVHPNETYDYIDYISKTLPAFPGAMFEMLIGTTFYLTPAGTINITAINGSYNRRNFRYQVKDTALGYPVASDMDNFLKEVTVYVPANRNYSIMIYPADNTPPISFEWKNFSNTGFENVTCGTAGNANLSWYNSSIRTLHKQFNLSITFARVSGYVNYSLVPSMVPDDLHVIPFLMEPGNMIHSQYGAMPYNISAINGLAGLKLTDVYIAGKGFYNITLPAGEEPRNFLLFAVIQNGTSATTKYFGGFRNISLSYGTLVNETNFTLYGMLGSVGNISLNRIDNGLILNISTMRQTFEIVNASNFTFGNTSAHIEATVDYSGSAYNATKFTWMIDVPQSQLYTNFSLIMLNTTGIQEMNVFVSGGEQGSNGQYIPKTKSFTVADITANPNITVTPFNPGARDKTLDTSDVTINLYYSNSTCDIPNPPPNCLISGSATMATFNPMRAVMGGGKISFRMGYSGILVHYVNVDLLASGPPDVSFDSAADTNQSGSTKFATALKFGSQGPKIYDYAFFSIPYEDTGTTGLNESMPVNFSMALLYDDNWNVIWNATQNGTDIGTLAGNFTHYNSSREDWSALLNGTNCTTPESLTLAADLNSSKPCYLDKLYNKIWIRIPHFSGSSPLVTGSLKTTAETVTPGSSPGGSTPVEWTSTFQISTEQFSEGYTKDLEEKNRVSFTIGSSTHTVGVTAVSATSATITVSSTTQQATLNIGDTKKFDLNSDNFYDVQVTLNSIESSKANVTLKSIHEAVSTTPAGTGETAGTTTPGEEITAGEGETKKMTTAWIWILAIVVLAIIAAIIIFLNFKKNRYSRRGY